MVGFMELVKPSTPQPLRMSTSNTVCADQSDEPNGQENGEQVEDAESDEDSSHSTADRQEYNGDFSKSEDIKKEDIAQQRNKDNEKQFPGQLHLQRQRQGQHSSDI